jgi:putative hemolysin
VVKRWIIVIEYGVVIVATIILGAFFSGTETAVVAASRVRLKARARRGRWRARILEGMIEKPELFFSTVLVGTNLSIIICTAAATSLAVTFYGDSGATVATVVMTPLLLILCEVIPKSAFLYHADRISILMAPVLKFFYCILWLIIMPVTLFTRVLLRFTNSSEERFKLISTREELIYLYGMGREESTVKRERLIMNRVLRFGNKIVGDLMVPLDEVVSFSSRATVEEAVDVANRHPFSRYPIATSVYDNVTGIVSLFGLLGLDGGEELSSVAHKPIYTSKEARAEELLVRLKDAALHMAVVVDRNNRALGIITLEDILEDLVGDISSEFEQIPRGE